MKTAGLTKSLLEGEWPDTGPLPPQLLQSTAAEKHSKPDTLWPSMSRVKLHGSSTHKSVMSAGVATTVYGIIGIFGAARYGHETQGDCLVNSWLGGKADGVLDAAMAVYLAISIPPMQVNSLTCSPGLQPNWSEMPIVSMLACLVACLPVPMCIQRETFAQLHSSRTGLGP